MAEQQDNYKINFDTNAKKAAQDANSLAQGLDNVDDATQKVNQSNKSLKAQMKEATVNLIQAQEKFGDYSKEALSAAKNLAELRDRIAEAGETAALFDPGKKFQVVAGAISAMASGFAVAQGAMGLFGAESEEVEKTLLKVQSAMALSQGLSTIADSAKDFQRLKAIVVDAMKSIATAKAVDTVATEANVVAENQGILAKGKSIIVTGAQTVATSVATAAQWAWNAAMMANPIGLLVAAIAALVAGAYFLIKAFQDSSAESEKAEKANKELSREIDNLAKSAEKSNKEMERSNNHMLAMAKASGASTAELRKLAEQLINNEVAEKRLNAVKAQSLFLEARRVASLEGATDSQKEAAKETAKKAYESFKEQNSIYNNSLDERKQLALDHQVQVRQEETDAANKLAEDRKKESDKRLEAQKEAQKKLLEEQKRAAEERRNEAKAISEKAKEENENESKTDLERLEEKYLKEKALLEAQKIDTLDLEIKFLNDRNDILLAQQAIEQEVKDKKKEEDDAKKKESDQKEIDDANAVAEAKKTIQDANISNVERGISLLSGFAGKNKKLQAAGIVAENAVAVAKSIISSNAAIPAINLKYAAIPGGQALAASEILANKISTGISIATSVAATAKALSALGGGGSASGGQVGGGGATQGATPPTVAFNNTAENQIGQSISRTQVEQPPLQVTVLESDITKAQNNVVKLNETNTL